MPPLRASPTFARFSQPGEQELSMLTTTRVPPDAPDGIRNLQVGCGPKHLRPNWWNTDLRPFKGLDEPMDAVKPWRWNNLLDHVYAEHFLEHLELQDAVEFLLNAGRALR